MARRTLTLGITEHAAVAQRALILGATEHARHAACRTVITLGIMECAQFVKQRALTRHTEQIINALFVERTSQTLEVVQKPVPMITQQVQQQQLALRLEQQLTRVVVATHGVKQQQLSAMT